MGDREGSRLSMPRVLVPVVRELRAARAHVRASREAGRASRPPTAGGRGRASARDAPRWADPAALGSRALAALAVAPLAGLLLRVALRGGHLAGGDGFLVLDQMQYLNWLRQAGEHVLIANLYDLAPGPRSFLHPGLLVSGALHALGLGMTAAYLVWKPVAVLALWAGALAWAGRFLRRRGGPRLAAAALALLFASPVAALVGWTGLGGERTRFHFDFLCGELTPTTTSGATSSPRSRSGCCRSALLAHERGRTALAAAAGLLIAWLQPWQGATYLLVLLGAEAVVWRRRRTPPPLRRLAIEGAATARAARLLPRAVAAGPVVGARRRARTTSAPGRGG